MARIAVFDSGLGSLSVIKQIQKATKSEIIYFADQKNFPYGNKSKAELASIIDHTIKNLKDVFNPDLVIVGSNTPTLILDIENKKTIGVKPPLKEAVKISKTNNIGILATRSTVNSKGLSNYIKQCNLPLNYKIKKIDTTNLIKLVEFGKFLTNKNLCRKIIKKELKEIFYKNKIDVCTLSSTHLPFLKKLLQEIFPDISFIDPAELLSRHISKKIKPNKRNSLRIFSSGNIKEFEKHLRLLGIKNKVTFLSF